jgi:hypothetical protein
MAVSEQLKKLVDQMPDPDGRGMLTENIDKEKIEKAIAEIHKGGRANVLGLIDMLGAPGSAGNVKPHYALHCLANHTLVVKDQNGRKQFCEALVGELGADRSDHIKAFLCQELGWAGREEAVPALGKLLPDEDLSSPAAMALVAIGGEGAAAQFRAAWPNAKGKARHSIIDGLAAVADPPSSVIFKGALGDKDPEIRMAAAAGLANLGDASASAALTSACASAEGWEAFQFAKSCLVLAEKLDAAGKKADARNVYENLIVVKPLKHIQHAAERGLAKLAGQKIPEKAPQ